MRTDTDLVFLYGTLRRGQSSTGRGMLDAYGTYKSQAQVEGRLYVVEGLAALVIEQDDGWVQGDVYQLDPIGEALGVLDQYEGVAGPEPGPYRRVARHVEMASGGVQPAWLYAWAAPLRGATPVTSGDYNAYQGA